MIGSPETTALRKRADYLDTEADEMEASGWDSLTRRSPQLLRIIAAEFRAAAEIADYGNFVEQLPGGVIVTHTHFVAGPAASPCYSGCPGNPARRERTP